MKLILSIFLIFVSLFIYGIFLSLFQLRVVTSDIVLENPPGYYDYRGVTHVHSRASTGSGSYSDILKAAKKTKLDFIIFTDINLQQRPLFIEGYYQDMMVLAGGEYSYIDSRLLYYGGSDENPPQGKTQTQVFFADKLSQKNNPYSDFIVLAHPYYSSYKWQGELPIGLNGIEVINLKSVLQKSWNERKLKTIFSVISYPLNPNIGFLSLFSHPTDEVLLWDQLNKSRKVIGFAGNDTTAKIAMSSSKHLKFPSYESSFNLISNHLLISSELTGDFKKDKQKILSSLQNGHFYMAIDLLGSPKGFLAEVRDDRKKTYLMGSKISMRKNLKLKILMPSQLKTNFQVRVIKDGEVFSTSTSRESEIEILSPGNYRVEVRVNPKLPIPRGNQLIPWIYSNVFYVE